jgi:hypothetical protein
MKWIYCCNSINFLSIRGGMIKGSMMLALDNEAEEIAARSTFMIVITSSITSMQLIVLDMISIYEF